MTLSAVTPFIPSQGLSPGATCPSHIAIRRQSWGPPCTCPAWAFFLGGSPASPVCIWLDLNYGLVPVWSPGDQVHRALLARRKGKEERVQTGSVTCRRGVQIPNLGPASIEICGDRKRMAKFCTPTVCHVSCCLPCHPPPSTSATLTLKALHTPSVSTLAPMLFPLPRAPSPLSLFG